MPDIDQGWFGLQHLVSCKVCSMGGMPKLQHDTNIQ